MKTIFSITAASLTMYAVVKLSEPLTITSYSLKISTIFDASRWIGYVRTLTSGFTSTSVRRAESTFGIPTDELQCRIWRCRFDSSTMS